MTQFAYDGKGELTQITDPLGHLTTIQYNSVGLISSITDAQNHVTSCVGSRELWRWSSFRAYALGEPERLR